MLNSDNIQVTTQVLVDTSASIRKINKDLDSKLAAINRAMNDLEKSWQSDASNDIRTAMNKLKPRFEQYKNVVENYCKYLDTAAKSYETTEGAVQKNAGNIDKLK